MSCIWHGFNLDPRKREKQCYYEWHCLVCWLRTLAHVVRLGLKYRLEPADQLVQLSLVLPEDADEQLQDVYLLSVRHHVGGHVNPPQGVCGG